MLVSSFCIVKIEGKVFAAKTSFKGFSWNLARAASTRERVLASEGGTEGGEGGREGRTVHASDHQFISPPSIC